MARPLHLLLCALASCTAQTSSETDHGSTGGGSSTATSTTTAVDVSDSGASTGVADGTGATTLPTQDIIPGVAIGPVSLGSRWQTIVSSLGQPTTNLRFGNLAFATFEDPGLEVLFAAPPGPALDPDALVLSVAALSESDYSGDVVPGDARGSIEATLGPPSELIGDVAYYEDGISVRYVDDTAESVTVYAPYVLRTSPPPMAAYEPLR